MKKIFIFSLAAVCMLHVHAQIPKAPENLPSPTAWNFTQYGNTPVSYFNGSAQVSVKIADFQYLGQKNNIGFSYFSSGFKPSDHPGWTGEGWNFNIGGAITRQVKGLPDEFAYYYMDWSTTPATKVWFYQGYIRQQPLPYEENFFCDMGSTFVTPDAGVHYYKWPHGIPYRGPVPTNCYDSAFTYDNCGDFARVIQNDNATRDGQRDEFSFNVFGYSGKFFMNGPDNIVVKSNHNLKVRMHSEFYDIPQELKPDNYYPGGQYCRHFIEGASPWEYYADNPQTISGFDIIADDGTVFTFGKSVEILNGYPVVDYTKLAIEYSTNSAVYGETIFQLRSKPSYWIADSWYLSRVKFPNNKIIDYRYERKNFILNPFINIYAAAVSSNWGTCSAPAPMPLNNLGVPSYGRSISPVYLTSVASDVLSATFHISATNELRPHPSRIPEPTTENFYAYGCRWYKLDSFMIRTHNSPTTYVKLLYNNNSSRRLRLQNIVVGTGEEAETTHFEYDIPGSEPAYDVDATDHLGYWNGVTASYSSLTSFSQYKQPNFAFAGFGLLKKIIYPTGGSSEFEYEANTYAKKVKPNKTQGVDNVSNTAYCGVRLKKITTRDAATSTEQVKEYLYVTGFNNTLLPGQISQLPSSGVLGISEHKYYWDNVLAFHNSTGTCTPATLRAFSNSPLGLNADASVGYSEVVERRSDNSYSIYKFSNHDNGYLDEPLIYTPFDIGTPYYQYSSRANERGHLLELLQYNAANVLMQKNKFTYSRINSANVFQEIQRLEVSFFDDTEYRNQSHSNVNHGLYPRDWMVGNTYKEFLNKFVQTKEETTVYDQNGLNPVVTVSESFYDNPSHGLVTRNVTSNSKGEQLSTTFKYPHDFTTTSTLDVMKNRNYLNTIIEQYSVLNKQGTEYVTSAKLNEYSILNTTDVVIDKQFDLHIANPLLKTSWQATTPGSYNFGQNSTWSKASAYANVSSVKKYDQYKNPVYVVNSNGLHFFTSYDKTGTKPTSVMRTGTYNFGTYCYNGFEGDAEDVFDFISGQYSWGYGFTGNAGFNGVLRSKEYINASTIYLVAKTNGAVPTLQIVQSSVSAGPALQAVGQRGDWTIYKASYSNFGTKLQITTNGNTIDEVRFLPSSDIWEMDTYVYSDNLVIASVDRNFMRTYYEYDSRGRLHLVRDENKNVIKKICYNFHDQPENCSVGTMPNWQLTGQWRCKPCPGNPVYTSNIREHQEKDMNPSSATYNTFRWVEDGVSSLCEALPGWEFVSWTCQVNQLNENTGNVINTEMDMNPCSSTYGQTRQVLVYDAGVCPPPVTCDCSMYGEGYRCIGNECEMGVKIVTSSYWEAGIWYCTYHYEYSDGSWSQDYQEASSYPCEV